MENCNIYLSGGMGDLPLSEQLKWRNQFVNAIKYGDFDYQKIPIIFNPPLYYSTALQCHKTDKEAMEYDLYKIRHSDVVVVNFNTPSSIGTAMELTVAQEHRIPIIGLNKDKYILHPWLVECCNRMCYDMKELVTHIVNYYLN